MNIITTLMGIVVIMLVLMKIWIILIYYNLLLPADSDIGFPTVINKIITLNEFWGNILMFAAGMLFIRAFHIKNT